MPKARRPNHCAARRFPRLGDSDFVSNKMPTQLDGIVTVSGWSAYVYYISPMQINILTPIDGSNAI
jgi:uncharacterized protein (TIGR03437 family)